MLRCKLAEIDIACLCFFDGGHVGFGSVGAIPRLVVRPEFLEQEPLDDDFDFDSLNTVGVGTPNSETTVTTTSSAPNDQQKPMIVNVGEAPAVVSPMAMQSTLVQSALCTVKQEKQLAKLKRLYVATWPMMNERLDAELEKVTLSPSSPPSCKAPETGERRHPPLTGWALCRTKVKADVSRGRGVCIPLMQSRARPTL